MTDRLERIREYIKNTPPSKYGDRYQMRAQEMLALENMALDDQPIDATVLAFDYGLADGPERGQREGEGMMTREELAAWFDLSPSVWEVQEAKRVFLREVQRLASSGETNKNTLIDCGLARVWRAGKLYQRDGFDAYRGRGDVV